MLLLLAPQAATVAAAQGPSPMVAAVDASQAPLGAVHFRLSEVDTGLPRTGRAAAGACEPARVRERHAGRLAPRPR